MGQMDLSVLFNRNYIVSKYSYSASELCTHWLMMFCERMHSPFQFCSPPEVPMVLRSHETTVGKMLHMGLRGASADCRSNAVCW